MDDYDSYFLIALLLREQYNNLTHVALFLPPLPEIIWHLADNRRELQRNVCSGWQQNYKTEVSLSSLSEFLLSCRCTLVETRLGTIHLGIF
jgi:hypothetical protein